MLKRFADFAKEEQALAGEKKKMHEILDKEVHLLGYRVCASKAVPGKDCLQLQFRFPSQDETFVAFTNSEVLKRQCEKYQNHFPFAATIAKRGNYYTFS